MRDVRWTYYRDLVWALVAKELKLRYQNTIFGYAWSVLHPLLFAMVFFVVIKMFMRISTEKYPYFLFLITGLFPWQWFANSVVASNYFFLNNSSLIKKVKFPSHCLVLAGVLNDLIHFVVSLPVILAFMLYYHTYPSLMWIWALPLMVALQLLLTYGVALTFATCNVFSKDLERLTVILTMIWLYLTPVIYPMEMIPARFHWILYANPMAGIIACWRGVLLEGRIPLDLLGSSAAVAVLAFAIGRKIYKSLEWRFAEVV